MSTLPAFPCHPDTPSSHDGMTLRDYFAAQAMQAMTHRGEANVEMVSIQAYAMADAMMKERGQE